MLRVLVLLFLLPTLALAGDGYFEPKRGSELRKSLMDAVRPHAIWNLAAPVEFVVEELRVHGDVGYASLSPQRPGGAAIDFWKTPLMKRGEINPEFYDGVYMHVLYQKSGNVWVAVHWSIGATDVWFASPEYCEVFRAVTPEFCF